MKNFDFKKLLQKDYLLNSNVPANIEFDLSLIIFFGVLLFISVLFAFIYRPKNYLYKSFKTRIIKMFLTCGILGFMLLFFRWQTLPFLNIRIWLIALAIFFIFWLFYNLSFYFIILPKQLNVYKKQIEFQSFLPQKK